MHAAGAGETGDKLVSDTSDFTNAQAGPSAGQAGHLPAPVDTPAVYPDTLFTRGTHHTDTEGSRAPWYSYAR